MVGPDSDVEVFSVTAGLGDRRDAKRVIRRLADARNVRVSYAHGLQWWWNGRLQVRAFGHLVNLEGFEEEAQGWASLQTTYF